MNNKKRIIVSVTNDLSTDQRVSKVCKFLVDNNVDVVLVGRTLKNSLPYNSEKIKSKRFSLIFNNGFLFYAEFNMRLFIFLLFTKFDALLANDLDTLPANFFVNFLKKKHLFYDSHEVFTEVPELINFPKKRKIWLRFESFIVPKLRHCYTVNQSIANYFNNKYSKKFEVIKNQPNCLAVTKCAREQLNLPIHKKLLFYKVLVSILIEAQKRLC